MIPFRFFVSVLLVSTLSRSFASAAEPDAAAHAHAGMAKGDRAAQAELGAQAAFDPRGVLWAVHKVSGHIAVSRSGDRGSTWSNPVLVTPAPEPTDTGGDARPKIALGPEGEIFLTWTRPLAKPYTGEIRFARSLDGGRTFSPSSVVHRDRQEITHRFDTIVVTAKGQLFVAWIDKRDLVEQPKTSGPGYRGAAVYFAVSDDRGATFRGDYKVADHACECCRIALVAREDGTVSAMWRHIFAPNIRDHAVATLHPDGTAGALRRTSYDEWKIDACPHHGPSLAFDASGPMHAVWFSAAPNRRGVFYGRVGGGDAEALRPVGSASAGHADIAVHGKRMAVAWKAFENGKTHLRGMTSDDGGDSWRESELASVTGSADHPRVLRTGDRFFVFWNSAERPLHVAPFP